jgi:hypothetical protein
MCHTAKRKLSYTKEKEEQTSFSHASIILLNFHPKLLKISIILISKRQKFYFKAILSSSLDSSDQHLVQCVPLEMTCTKELGLVLLNTTSFLLNQIAQQRAGAPIRI